MGLQCGVSQESWSLVTATWMAGAVDSRRYFRLGVWQWHQQYEHATLMTCSWHPELMALLCRLGMRDAKLGGLRKIF